MRKQILLQVRHRRNQTMQPRNLQQKSQGMDGILPSFKPLQTKLQKTPLLKLLQETLSSFHWTNNRLRLMP